MKSGEVRMGNRNNDTNWRLKSPI